MIDKGGLQELNDDIYEKGSVDREHLLKFLTLINTNDGAVVSEQVREWLGSLHADPKYSKIIFPTGDIDAILSDLGSYGRLQAETLHNLNAPGGSSRELPIQ